MKRVAAVLAAALVWLALVAGWVASAPDVPAAGRADAAIVLGAAVAGSEPSPVFAARIDEAAALWRTGQVRRIVLTGGRAPGDALAESEAARAYLIARGIDPAAILVETRSRTTRENLIEARRIMPPHGLADALVVSDPMHLPRAMAIARDLGLAAWPAPARASRYRSWRTRVPFALREAWFLHVHWFAGR